MRLFELMENINETKKQGIMVLNKIDIHSDAVNKEEYVRLTSDFKLLFIDVLAKTGQII